MSCIVEYCVSDLGIDFKCEDITDINLNPKFQNKCIAFAKKVLKKINKEPTGLSGGSNYFRVECFLSEDEGNELFMFTPRGSFVINL